MAYERIRFEVEVLEHRPLTNPVKADLLAKYNYTPDPSHTYGAIVAVHLNGAHEQIIARQFPFTFRLADYETPTGTSDLLAAIEAAARVQRNAYLNTRPLSDLAKFRFPL